MRVHTLLLCALAFLGFSDVSSVSVTVNFYAESSCSSSLNSITYDMQTCDVSTGECTQPCYTWERSAQGSTHTNGAANFECYAGWGILYNQWINKGGCTSIADSKTKEARVGCCILEPSGNMYSKITTSSGLTIDSCKSTVPSHLPPIGDCTPIYDAASGGASGPGGMGPMGNPKIILVVIALIAVSCCVYCACKTRQSNNDESNAPQRVRSSSDDESGIEMLPPSSVTVHPEDPRYARTFR